MSAGEAWQQQAALGHGLSVLRPGSTPMHVVFKDFHQRSQSLLLWLASAEEQRQKALVTDPKADHQDLLRCQKQLMVSFFLGASAQPLPAAEHPTLSRLPSVPCVT